MARFDWIWLQVQKNALGTIKACLVEILRPTEGLAAKVRALLSVLFAGGLCAGCAVVNSVTFEDIVQNSKKPQGIIYALPVGLVEVSLVVKEDTAEYRILYGAEKYYPSPHSKDRFILQHRPLPNYEDDITIEVSSNSLIRKVHANTKDKTDEIIVALAKAFKGFQLSVSEPRPTGFGIIAQTIIDPSKETSLARAARALSQRGREFAKSKFTETCHGNQREKLHCRRYARYSRDKFRLVRLSVTMPKRIAPQKAANCSAGICYRIKEPYVIQHKIDGVKGARIVHIPNRSPLIELNIRRAFLVDKIQNIDFDENGFLKEATITKKSELAALANLPLAIVNAIADEASVRVKIQNEQVKVANAKLDVIEAQQQLDAAKRGGSPN